MIFIENDTDMEWVIESTSEDGHYITLRMTGTRTQRVVSYGELVREYEYIEDDADVI